LYLVFRVILKEKQAKNRNENDQIVPLKHEIAFGELSSPRRASCNYWHVGLGGLIKKLLSLVKNKTWKMVSKPVVRQITFLIKLN